MTAAHKAGNAVAEWTLREQLVLASAVQRSGDQNWVSASRTVKPLSDESRPADYFSQKNCAQQYAALLDKTGTPKRKRTSDGTPEVVATMEQQIVRGLTEKRINELNETLTAMREEYSTLQKEVELLEKGELDDKLPEMWEQMQRELAAESELGKKEKEGLRLRLPSSSSSSASSASSSIAKYQEQLKLSRRRSPPGSFNLGASSAGSCDIPPAAASPAGGGGDKMVAMGNEKQEIVVPMETQPVSVIHTAGGVAIKKEATPTRSNPATPTDCYLGSPLPRVFTTPKEDKFSSSMPPLPTDVHIIVQHPNTAISGTCEMNNTPAPPAVDDAPPLPLLPPPPPPPPHTSTQSTKPPSPSPSSSSSSPPPTSSTSKSDAPISATSKGPPPDDSPSLIEVPSRSTDPRKRSPLLETQRSVTSSGTSAAESDNLPSSFQSRTGEAITTVAESVKPLPPSTSPAATGGPSERSVGTVVSVGAVISTAPSKAVLSPVKTFSVAKPVFVSSGVPTAAVAPIVSLKSVVTATPILAPHPLHPSQPSHLHHSSPHPPHTHIVPPSALAPQVKTTPTPQPSHVTTPAPPSEPENKTTSSATGNGGSHTTSASAEKQRDKKDDLAADSAQVKRSLEAKIKMSSTGTATAEMPTSGKPARAAEATFAETKMRLREVLQSKTALQQLQQAKPDKPVSSSFRPAHRDSTEETIPPSEETKDSDASKITNVTSTSPPPPPASPAPPTTSMTTPPPLVRVTPPPSGRLTRSGRKEGQQRASQERDTQQSRSATPAVEHSTPKSPPSGSCDQPVTIVTSPVDEDDGETPIRTRKSGRAFLKKQLAPQSRKRKLLDRDFEEGHSVESTDMESEEEPTSSLPSAVPSPAPSQSEMDPEALQSHKQWKKAIMLVWRHAAQHKYANLFMYPVREDDAPGYADVILRPMSLQVIKKKVESGAIKTDNEFQRDILLLFQNAFMYNSSDHDVYQMAEEMHADVMENIQDYLATQAQLQLLSQSTTPKQLRSREARKGDSHDESGVFSPAPTKKRRTRADD